MAFLTSLPAEILAYILGHLSEDGSTLKSCSLVCRALSPVSQYYLLSKVDFEFLDHLEAEPYRSHITHLTLSPKSEILAAYPDPPIEAALALPRMRGISVSKVSFQHMSFPAAVYARFTAFTAVVELSLHETKHPDREHIQGILCALPNLSIVSLRAVTLLKYPSGVGRYFKRNPPELPQESSGPRLTRLRASPSYAMDGTTAVVEWLQHTPTAETLRKLEIPAESQNSHVVLDGFGPSVEFLTIERLESITKRWDVASIGQYVALRALDVGWDLCGTQRWYQLYKLLYSMRSSNFCELVLRFDATQDLNSIIDLDALLASPIDNYLTRSFPRLQRVCIIIRADANTLPWTKRGQVGCAVRRWMSRLDALGKVQVEFDYVGKVPAASYL